MKIHQSNSGRKIRIIATVIIVVFIIISCFCYSLPVKEVEDSMFERFNTRLDMRVEKIFCIAGTVGKEFRPYLSCGYLDVNNNKLGTKDIDLQDGVDAILLYSQAPIGGIDYERNSPRKVQLSHLGTIDRLSWPEIYWLYSVVDTISNGQPR